jgi:hypothetical protein
LTLPGTIRVKDFQKLRAKAYLAVSHSLLPAERVEDGHGPVVGDDGEGPDLGQPRHVPKGSEYQTTCRGKCRETPIPNVLQYGSH